MAFLNAEAVYEVTGLSADERRAALNFLQGAVYCWVKSRSDEHFALRDLVGGENADWSGTPLQVLWLKHSSVGKAASQAYEQAAKDAGWLLKQVLQDDQRCFETQAGGFVNCYKWVR